MTEKRKLPGLADIISDAPPSKYFKEPPAVVLHCLYCDREQPRDRLVCPGCGSQETVEESTWVEKFGKLTKGSYLDAEVSEIHAWNRVLSPGEIHQLVDRMERGDRSDCDCIICKRLRDPRWEFEVRYTNVT